MNTTTLRKNGARKEYSPLERRRRYRRISLYVCLGLGVAVVSILVIIELFAGRFLNTFGKRKLEGAFAQSNPGYALRMGRLDYSPGANRLTASSVTLSGPGSKLVADRVAVTGIHWLALLRKSAPLSEILGKAEALATKLEVQFTESQYRLRCAQLRASVPFSELVAQGTELVPLVDDETFFSAHAFRTTRFRVDVPECRISGLDCLPLIERKSYRARLIEISRPSLDAFVNRDKAVAPILHSPRMPNEALAAILQPLQVDSLVITNGHLNYRERLSVGGQPGVLTFGAINLSCEGIANRLVASSAMVLRAKSTFMNAAELKVLLTIPVCSPDFSLHYSGSLGSMDLTQLDAFLEFAEHLKIKSGNAQRVSFDVAVTSGVARGSVQAAYSKLEVTFLDKHTGSEKGLQNRLNSFFANAFKIRNANGPGEAGPMKQGKVDYTRGREDEFQQFLWFALRTGVLDVISH